MVSSLTFFRSVIIISFGNTAVVDHDKMLKQSFIDLS